MVVAQLHFSEALETPFVELLEPATRLAAPPDEPDQRPQRRLAALPALHRLEQTVDRENDPALGLKAARRMHFGQVGALDYLVATSATVDAAFETLGRYMSLVTDTLQVRREATNARIAIFFERSLSTPPVAADFTMAGIYHCQRETLFSQIDELECWLPYPSPSDLREHHATFGNVRLRFSALAMAFSFPVSCLARPLPRADERLHAILSAHADRTLSSLPAADTVAQRVLALIEQRNGAILPSASQVAGRLAMSPRTLGRKLEQEGTTYSEVIATWRRRKALHYLSHPHPDVAGIAAHLGYSHPVGFHRAFKRWTDQTPLGYHRMLHRRERPQPRA